MPNRVRRNSVVDMLSKVPVHRGSLLKSLDNLLKTIESSESSVMIPTLLRDKCDFDAWELLFVAKILKASILGHTDLVEFYMNHMGHSGAQLRAQANQTPLSTGGATSPMSASAPDGFGGAQAGSGNNSIPASSNSLNSSASSSMSSSSSVSSVLAAQSPPQPIRSPPQQQSSSSSASWMSASQQTQTSGATANSASSSAASLSSSSGGQTNDSSTLGLQMDQEVAQASSAPISIGQPIVDPISLPSPQETFLATRPLLVRQAQPPSLLQLTTTNNHINSVSGFTNSSIEQLTSQLANAIQNNGAQAGDPVPNQEGSLSISTSSTPTGQAVGGANTVGGSIQSGASPHGHELKTSRSAGCLFRINSSGASSPRTPAQTPTTPYPQAETLANGQLTPSNGLLSDPSAPVKLLLQIEQLKSSITHVTGLLESVVELYKKSIDDIA